MLEYFLIATSCVLFVLFLFERRRVILAQNEISLLRERFRMRGIRASEFAHELKHPIAAISATIDALRHELKDEVDREVSERMEALSVEARQVYSFIHDFLLVCMAETGHLSGRPESLSLHNISQQVAKLLEAQCQLKDMTIDLQALSDDIYVFVDKLHLKQILFNILNNAVVHNAKGTHIEISAERHPSIEQVVITIKDNGCGMSEQDASKIFEAFYSGNHEQDGSGIGLHLCHELVSFSGGSIVCKSQPQAGTRFIITLPAGVVPTAERLLRTKKVLLVSEGNKYSAHVAQQVESLGASVDSISEVVSALQALSMDTYDAVIVDHKVDNDCGFELAKLIDNELGLRHTKKFVALTDESFDPELFSMHDQQAWPVTKPVLKELLDS